MTAPLGPGLGTRTPTTALQAIEPRRTRESGPRPAAGHARPMLAAVLIAGGLLTTACGGQDPTNNADAPRAAATRGIPTTPPTALPTSPAPTLEDEAPMDLNITTPDGVAIRGTLDDTATARDFAALLPLTLHLSDFSSTEKISDLPRPLDTTGAPADYTGQPGDITYYAPWGNLALFYRNGPRATGLIRLGRLEPGATAALANLNGDITLTRDTTQPNS